MKIEFNKLKEELKYNDRVVKAYCRVRNLENGLRKKDEVVLTEPLSSSDKPRPYSPKVFPNGAWLIMAMVPQTDPYLAPVSIKTTAKQLVDIWNVLDGKYVTKSGEVQIDAGYSIHYSTSNTTLGCIRIEKKKDLLDLVDAIRESIAKKELVSIVVS